MSDFLNPYNFVRIPDAPQPQDDDPESQLLWRCPPPPHDRQTGLSGRIECEMEVLTPLFVSDSDSVAEDENGHKIYDFFNVDGQRMIPATALRGSIRSVFEAVSNSTFGVFDESDQPLFYRMPPEKALGLVPAIVQKGENGKYLELLPGSKKIGSTSNKSHAAWLPAYRNTTKLNNEKKKKHVLAKSDLFRIPEDCLDQSICWGAIRYISHKGFPHEQIDCVYKDEETLRKWISRQPNSQEYRAYPGYVYITDLNIETKQYERFFFYDPNEPREYAMLSDNQVEKRYNALMQDYHNRRDEIRNSLNSQESNGRRIRPSIFIEHRFTLRSGSLVYAELSGTPGNYEAVALYPVNVSRVAYTTPVKDLLPRHALPAKDYHALCLASRVFGWVHPQADDALVQRVAYAGRVQFSHALVGEADMERGPFTLQILGSPNPTSVEFYLNINPRNVNAHRDKPHGYDAPGVSLKGRKFYRHHGDVEMGHKDIKSDDPNKFNRSLTEVVRPGTRLRFTIDFQNLQPVELGALLWTVQLQEGNWQGVHRVGYAKPLGLGSTTIDVTQLTLFDAKQRYVEGTAGRVSGDTQHYINVFTAAMQRLYGQAFAQQVHLQDLQRLLDRGGAAVPVHYPRLGDNNEKNFEWFVQNKNNKQQSPQILAYPTENEALPKRP